MIEVIYNSKNSIKNTNIDNYKSANGVSLINAFDLGNNDLSVIKRKLGISTSTLRHFLDQREIPRIEKYKFHDVIIIKTVSNKKTKTLGIVKHRNYILTVCSENINIIPEKESFKSSNDLLKDILNKIIKNFSDNIDKLEEEVNYQEDVTFDEKVNNDPKPIFKLKKELICLKKALNSNKEVISKMENMEDINIELNQMIDIENTLSSRITAIMEMYMSFTSNKLNETMKSFTVIASLLLLPMLISGIYGMNVILPMQNTEGSFFIILGIMLIFMVSMLIYFKFRKWI